MIPITYLGFYQDYFSKFPDFDEDTTFYVHIHVLVASLWVLLLIAQPLLIRNSKYSLHRTFGKLSYAIFPILLLTFIPLMVSKYYRGEYKGLLFPVMDIILMTTFYLMAIRNKKKISLHMRYMIAIPLVFLSPTMGRILGQNISNPNLDPNHVLYGSINLLLVALIIWDKSNGKKYQPYVIALAGFIIYELAYHIVFKVL